MASSSATGPKSTITKTSDGLPRSTGTSNSKANVGAIVGGKLFRLPPLHRVATTQLLQGLDERLRGLSEKSE